MIYSATDGTIVVGMVGGVVIYQMGQELFAKARNNTGVTIPDGSVVYISGGLGDQVLMSLASSADPDTYEMIGIVTEDVLHTATGHITVDGVVHEYDTSAWAVGTRLYAGVDYGSLTNAPSQDASHAIIKICIVQRQHANDGELLILDIVPFTFADTFNGSLRYTVRNLSDGPLAQSMFSVMNDKTNRASFAIGGSGFPLGADLVSVYNQGNATMAYVNDGPVPHCWFSNPWGLGNFGAYSNEIMRLTSAGNLEIQGTVDVSGNKLLDVADGTDPTDGMNFGQHSDPVSYTHLTLPTKA